MAPQRCQRTARESNRTPRRVESTEAEHKAFTSGEVNGLSIDVGIRKDKLTKTEKNWGEVARSLGKQPPAQEEGTEEVSHIEYTQAQSGMPGPSLGRKPTPTQAKPCRPHREPPHHR